MKEKAIVVLVINHARNVLEKIKILVKLAIQS